MIKKKRKGKDSSRDSSIPKRLRLKRGEKAAFKVISLEYHESYFVTKGQKLSFIFSIDFRKKVRTYPVYYVEFLKRSNTLLIEYNHYLIYKLTEEEMKIYIEEYILDMI